MSTEKPQDTSKIADGAAAVSPSAGSAFASTDAKATETKASPPSKAKAAVEGTAVAAFQSLIGHWDVEITHAKMPGTVVRGDTSFEWIEGGRFVLQRTRLDHALFPDSLIVIGGAMEGLPSPTATASAAASASATTTAASSEPLHMQYFDSRGVHRVYSIAFDGKELTMRRDCAGFDQRARATLSSGGSGGSDTASSASGEASSSGSASSGARDAAAVVVRGVWQLNEKDAGFRDDVFFAWTKKATESKTAPERKYESKLPNAGQSLLKVWDPRGLHAAKPTTAWSLEQVARFVLCKKFEADIQALVAEGVRLDDTYLIDEWERLRTTLTILELPQASLSSLSSEAAGLVLSAVREFESSDAILQVGMSMDEYRRFSALSSQLVRQGAKE